MLDEALSCPCLFRGRSSATGVFDGGYRNMFSDPQTIEAERLLLRTVVGTLKDHPAAGVNPGNEPDLFALFPTVTGRAWVHGRSAYT
jgi:hypothetical protein